MRANSLLQGGSTVLVQFVGAAAGAALFAVARWLPAGIDAVSHLRGVALLAGVRGRFRPPRDDRVVRVLTLATVPLGLGSAAAWGAWSSPPSTSGTSTARATGCF
ncbi:hypothetical protein ABZV75_14040 [Streptomyces flaveolus]|uniref:hypothetical protein n=1 Tax=Streptomyces flaveolus TaxID=67297 RepID=UPI0033B50786